MEPVRGTKAAQNGTGRPLRRGLLPAYGSISLVEDDPKARLCRVYGPDGKLVALIDPQTRERTTVTAPARRKFGQLAVLPPHAGVTQEAERRVESGPPMSDLNAGPPMALPKAGSEPAPAPGEASRKGRSLKLSLYPLKPDEALTALLAVPKPPEPTAVIRARPVPVVPMADSPKDRADWLKETRRFVAELDPKCPPSSAEFRAAVVLMAGWLGQSAEALAAASGEDPAWCAQLASRWRSIGLWNQRGRPGRHFSGPLAAAMMSEQKDDRSVQTSGLTFWLIVLQGLGHVEYDPKTEKWRASEQMMREAHGQTLS